MELCWWGRKDSVLPVLRASTTTVAQFFPDTRPRDSDPSKCILAGTGWGTCALVPYYEFVVRDSLEIMFRISFPYANPRGYKCPSNNMYSCTSVVLMSYLCCVALLALVIRNQLLERTRSYSEYPGALRYPGGSQTSSLLLTNARGIAVECGKAQKVLNFSPRD
jgi:hypothetical protein